MLITTASMGTRASNVTYARPEARTGQRLREKLCQTMTQKWANFCTLESSPCERSALSSHKACASFRSLRNLDGLAAITLKHKLTEARPGRQKKALPTYRSEP